METLVAFEGETNAPRYFFVYPVSPVSPLPSRPNANIMFYSWDEKQPFAREPPPPRPNQHHHPPLIYMRAERAVRSLLGGDWDVDKPGRRAVNLDGWRPPASDARAAEDNEK